MATACEPPTGGVPTPVSVPLGPADGLDRESWAENKFGEEPLGDKRLTRRLVTSAAVQAERSSFVSAVQGRGALVCGCWHEHVPENILTARARCGQGQGRGALRRQRPQLRDPSGLQGPWQARTGTRRARSGCYAYDSCGERRRLAARRPARMTRRPARPRRTGRQRKTQRWVRGLRDCSLPGACGWSR